MKIFSRTVLLLFFYSQYFMAKAQKGNYIYQINLHAGFILKHSDNMAHLANQRPLGIIVDIGKQTRGEKTWEQLYKYPTIGYSLVFFNMDQRKALGNSK